MKKIIQLRELPASSAWRRQAVVLYDAVLLKCMGMKICLVFAFAGLYTCCSAQNNTAAGVLPLAFPGAEGFGKHTTGGRGGSVYIVSNLEDAGAGSLRKAVSTAEPRIIVFSVAGTIHLKSRLSIKGDKTIAGQTAPGGGICLADQPVVLSGDNIIVRFLRFRMGDRYQNGGMKDGAGANDAFGGAGRKNIIIDHCSMSWSTDEVCSVYRGDSTTLQWNILSEPLNYSYHFEKGDTDFEHHGYGGIWGGAHFTAHHNLFAHCNSRNPRFNGARLGAGSELADFCNNVIYNWGGNSIYGGEGGSYNIVNNYFKYGPSTRSAVKYRIVNPNKEEQRNTPFGHYYVDGNFVDGASEITDDNYKGIHMGNNGTEADKKAAVRSRPFEVMTFSLQSAAEAYTAVLKNAGAILPERDTLDQRIVNDVQHRTGSLIDVQGGYPHGTPYEQTITAWPVLRQEQPAPDADQDGIPDTWETANGLNPGNNQDAAIRTIDKNYSNIEVYINSLVK
ncbi:pectate lyase family protein [Niabella beijingensis]|uniref:pectate lyase family protein n=1 Tax=Niabella beijingensis TaxID=2872700 RepID=UPI001CBAAF74|nr:pectate lyase [Niabella beijingensis]MBZ4188993.1 pectate lyase [Niabella beijingensis]